MIDFEKDYYQVLEINPDANKEAIKLAYRKLVKLYHPDLHPGISDNEEKIKAINEAYEVLGNRETKDTYDHYILSRNAYREKIKSRPDHRRSILKKRIVTKEYRYYLKGVVTIKYWGDGDEKSSYDTLRDVSYILHISDLKVEIAANNIYREANLPSEFTEVFAKQKPTKLAIPNPVRCEIHDAKGICYVKLNLESFILLHPVVENSTKFENQVFGTLKGEAYAYFKETKQYEETYEVEECFGETGKVEEKIIDGIQYQRKQYYSADCQTYWCDWIPKILRKTVIPTGRSNRKGNYTQYEYYYSDHQGTYWGTWQYRPIRGGSTSLGFGGLGCLPSLGLGGLLFWVFFFHLSFLPVLLVILVVFLLLRFIPFYKIGRGVSNFFGITYLLLCLWVIIMAVRGATHQSVQSSRVSPNPPPIVENHAIKKPKKSTQNSNSPVIHNDFITQQIQWNDYGQHNYKGSFRLSKQEIIAAADYRNTLQVQTSGQEVAYDQLVDDLSTYHPSGLAGLYQMFDSLQVTHQLSKNAFAECMVSFVQSIPYTLILPEACDPNLYQDQFIDDYLHRPGARCEGPVKYGLYSPIEFMATMEGDCDTRTVLLYTLFDHYGYDVAVLSSEYYGHSLLGINLPYSGMSYPDQNKHYVLWETTAGLIAPGVLPNQISNINYWRISIKSNNNDHY